MGSIRSRPKLSNFLNLPPVQVAYDYVMHGTTTFFSILDANQEMLEIQMELYLYIDVAKCMYNKLILTKITKIS